MTLRSGPSKKSLFWILLLAILTTSAWFTWSRLFPSPATASPAAIGRWLAKRDLSRASTDTQLALVDRLQELLLAETGLEAFPEASPADLEQLAENVKLLSRAWFLERGEAYQQVGAGERMPFLRLQVDTVITWGEFDNQLQARRRRLAGLRWSSRASFIKEEISALHRL